MTLSARGATAFALSIGMVLGAAAVVPAHATPFGSGAALAEIARPKSQEIRWWNHGHHYGWWRGHHDGWWHHHHHWRD